jgi:hypothetical protein
VEPYSEAIVCLEKLSSLATPREKLACLSESFGAMKSAVVQFHKGRVELATMDDVLPLSIYVVSQARVNNLASELDLLNDFVQINVSNSKLGIKNIRALIRAGKASAH